MLSEITFALLFLSGVQAAIGPVADLHIVNRDISPDGYNRSFVVLNFDNISHSLNPFPEAY